MEDQPGVLTAAKIRLAIEMMKKTESPQFKDYYKAIPIPSEWFGTQIPDGVLGKMEGVKFLEHKDTAMEEYFRYVDEKIKRDWGK